MYCHCRLVSNHAVCKETKAVRLLIHFIIIIIIVLSADTSYACIRKERALVLHLLSSRLHDFFSSTMMRLLFIGWLCIMNVVHSSPGCFQWPCFSTTPAIHHGFMAPQENPSFELVKPDSDRYFRKELPKSVNEPIFYHVLCDKFNSWHGYSLTDIQRHAQSLKVKEQSPWSQWESFESSWVFLGYRGTSHIWAQEAAMHHYIPHRGGMKTYGDGIYMTPERDQAHFYAHRYSSSGGHARVCYNFAPQSILSRLLTCGLVSRREYPQSVHSQQRIQVAPSEASVRYSQLKADPYRVQYSHVYPTAFLPYIKVICVHASEQFLTKPDLFQSNRLYFNPSVNEIQLNSELVPREEQ